MKGPEDWPKHRPLGWANDHTGDKPEMNPDDWAAEHCLYGKLFRYIDDQINFPLIEIKEADLQRLEGYEFFEPSWVIADQPVIFAIFDRDERLIYGPEGYASDYSPESLVAKEGYGSTKDFRRMNPTPKLQTKIRDMDIWIRLGLPAKVFLPSLPRKS